MKRLALALVVMMTLAASASAAVGNFTGFETGDSREMSGTSGTFSYSTTTVRTGTYALRCNPTTTGNGSVTMTGHGADGAFAATLNATAVRFYFRYATKPASNSEEIYSAAQLIVRINSSGNLLAYNGTTLLATGSAVLSSGTWYRIEVRSNSSNSWVVTLDGATELSGSDNMAVTATTGAKLGKVTNRNGQSVDFFYDDVIASDTFAAIGAGQCARLGLSGDGNYTAWVAGVGAGDYTDCDEVSSDDATSYSKTSTNTAAETHAVTDTTGIVAGGDTINAVKSLIITRDNSGNTNTLQLRTRVNSTDIDLTNLDGAGLWDTLAAVYTTDPSASGAITTGDLDTWEVGVEKTQTQSRELNYTLGVVMVDFTPAAPPSATIVPILMRQYRSRIQ